MADSYDSFKFWTSYYDALQDMTNDEAGEFVKGLCGYIFAGAEPEFSSRLLTVSFKLIKDSAEHSMLIAREARENGKKGAYKKQQNPSSKSKSSVGRRGASSGGKSTSSSTPASPASRGASSVKYSSVACDSIATHTAPQTALGADAAPGGASSPAPDVDITVPPKLNIKRPEGLPTMSQLRGTPPPTE